jgi:AcrR family transcriptional regulator
MSPRTTRTPEATRDLIIEAASQLVIAQGSTHLTLDAVAKQAGVSKGGLLYHFASKEALVQGMVQHLLDDFTAKITAYHSGDPAAGGWLRGYLHATFEDSDDDHLFSGALLAAIGTNPDLLDPVRAAYAEWQQRTEATGIDPVLATLIRLAIDGLWYAELFNVGRLDPSMRAHVISRLLALTSGQA